MNENIRVVRNLLANDQRGCRVEGLGQIALSSSLARYIRAEEGIFLTPYPMATLGDAHVLSVKRLPTPQRVGAIQLRRSWGP